MNPPSWIEYNGELIENPEDIFYRNNADECQWIKNRNRSYTKVFTLSELPAKAKLIFEGLDTYAVIYLNNMRIGAEFENYQKTS